MKKPLYVFGHQNPDTDSICSSIAYANLKRQMGYDEVVAARLGDVNKETKFALNYFRVDDPVLIETLNPQVNDLNLVNIQSLKEDDTLKKALSLIISQKGHIIPIVDEDNKFTGIISISDIAPAYMGLAGKSLLNITETPFKNIRNVLDATIIVGDIEGKEVEGNVYTSAELLTDLAISSNDVVIYTLDDGLEKKVYQSGAGLIIVAESLHQHQAINIPEDYNGVVLSVQYSIFEIIKLMSQAIPVKTMVNTNMLEYFDMDDYIDEVKDNMLSSKHRRFPVIDKEGYVKGIISKSSLLKINRKKVILVDHNEKGQSAKGIEEAEIIEIIDHHRVADIHTMAPLYFRAEPLGCTSTIIAKIHEEREIPFDKKHAGIMLSAILSDTLLFHSPTCTNEDKRIAHKLANIADVDLHKYGMEMITAGTTLEGESAESLIFRDMKKFSLGKYKVAISQINTTDFEGFNYVKSEVVDEMEDFAKKDKVDLVLMMVTNIISEGTELVAVGSERWIVENAFEFQRNEVSKFLPKVFSRKKQVVPVIMNASRL
ncbi:putative manganese-dependent inorganic diphosphatase [Vallitalea okinawensis]|uniref:putative manganese-dependent inorganic diphosphatase n=1 Tax=Vallitalea okinawensis TaxID=2078660 RepID=UPI000CFB1708|nr:putative manganese-dependent inorganic diphosphatase [Vallitalea okinawensis]